MFEDIKKKSGEFKIMSIKTDLNSFTFIYITFFNSLFLQIFDFHSGVSRFFFKYKIRHV